MMHLGYVGISMQMRSTGHRSTHSAGLRAVLRIVPLIVGLLVPLWRPTLVAIAAPEWEECYEEVRLDDGEVLEAAGDGEAWEEGAPEDGGGDEDGEALGEGGYDVLEAEMAAGRSYLDQLLDEINWRRSGVGTPPLAYVSASANAALNRHVADLTATMLSSGVCTHGVGDPPRFGWDYVAETGFSGEGTGEVIACPDADGFWTAARVADGWLGSPYHAQILYADPSANVVACGAYGPQNGGRAYQTVLCVTYRV